jgi:hypothetical protein
MGSIVAHLTSHCAFFRTKGAGQDSEFDENAEMFESEKRDFDWVSSPPWKLFQSMRRGHVSQFEPF